MTGQCWEEQVSKTKYKVGAYLSADPREIKAEKKVAKFKYKDTNI